VISILTECNGEHIYMLVVNTVANDSFHVHAVRQRLARKFGEITQYLQWCILAQRPHLGASGTANGFDC
jgi:hypothetical protein